MGGTCENNPSLSAEEFARNLRKRAEQAAAASVQHAGLAERYLELSSQLAVLAEKASTSSKEELQSALAAIETAVAQSADLLPPGKKDSVESAGEALPLSTDASTVADETERAVQPDLPKDFDPAESSVAGTDTASPDTPALSEHAAKTSDERARNRLRGRAKTRSLVERVRSVKLAMAKRVRLKVNKEDLKPNQRNTIKELNRSRGSIFSSVLMVVVALFVLSMITLQFEAEIPVPPIMSAFAEEIEDIEEPLPVEMPEEEQGEQLEEQTEESVEEPEPVEEEMEEPDKEPEAGPKLEVVTKETDAPEAEGEETAVDAGNSSDADMDSVDNRSAAGRKQLLQKYGGSAASESAVQRALDWLVSVQQPNGSWDFTQVGPAGSPGKVYNPIGGTAYALLPFLAAGQTHRTGKYRKSVRGGIDFLTKVGIAAPAGYDLRGVVNKGDQDHEPNEAYYVHGAATLTLCEAYGMTKDRRLKQAAQGALSFLLNSQDPRGGGWRYTPQQAGSTSVTVIQVMALMAAKKVNLKVPDTTLNGVMHYLDTVQVDGEGRYAYETKKKTYKGSATAMALLCRMYLGWGRDDGDMRDGIALLDKAGPYDNRYTTYFATQVMRNWGGDEWQRWNERMRDDLVATQEQDGPGKGSWKPRTGMHKRSGGRLLETCLATLTLEVYYRYKPILPEETDRRVAAE